MTTPSQLATAIETARRIVLGAVKVPKPSSSQAKLLAEQLAEAASQIREVKS